MPRSLALLIFVVLFAGTAAAQSSNTSLAAPAAVAENPAPLVEPKKPKKVGTNDIPRRGTICKMAALSEDSVCIAAC